MEQEVAVRVGLQLRHLNSHKYAINNWVFYVYVYVHVHIYVWDAPFLCNSFSICSLFCSVLYLPHSKHRLMVEQPASASSASSVSPASPASPTSPASLASPASPASPTSFPASPTSQPTRWYYNFTVTVTAINYLHVLYNDTGMFRFAKRETRNVKRETGNV